MTSRADPQGTTDAAVALITARAFHMMGVDAERAWTGDEATAWECMIEVTRRLRRGAEELLEQDDLSISMLGIMGRLSRAEALTLRQTALAEAMGLSLSRVSRVIDLLQARGLVERHTCPSDARATNVLLTPAGGERLRIAQTHLFDYVQERFVGRLEPDEATALATIFTRILREI